jgi:hypothetical protein
MISDHIYKMSDKAYSMRPKKLTLKNYLRARERLIARLPDPAHTLRGTLVSRFRRCGRANCRCAREGEPGHGPAYYLIAAIGPGKTVQVYVPKEHKEKVELWVQNFKQTREVLEEISALNRELLKGGELFKVRIG